MLKATIDGSPCCRDGTARARLQSYTCHEHHGCPAAHGGDEGIAVADMPSSAAAEPPKTAGISTRSTSRRKEPPTQKDDRAGPPRRDPHASMLPPERFFTRPRPSADIRRSRSLSNSQMDHAASMCNAAPPGRLSLNVRILLLVQYIEI
jgi:hypothetical protein